MISTRHLFYAMVLLLATSGAASWIASGMLVGLAPAAAADAVLPGTDPLTIDRPLDEVMVEGLNRFCLRRTGGRHETSGATARRQRDGVSQ
jgi:hypothetical protein